MNAAFAVLLAYVSAPPALFAAAKAALAVMNAALAWLNAELELEPEFAVANAALACAYAKFAVRDEYPSNAPPPDMYLLVV